MGERLAADRGGCAELLVTAQFLAAPPPVLAGQARIWLYRDWQLSESLNLANIDVNSRYFGSVANGGVFYCDVSLGHYHIHPKLWPVHAASG